MKKKVEILNNILKDLDGLTVVECLDILNTVKVEINYSSTLHHKEDLLQQ